MVLGDEICIQYFNLTPEDTSILGGSRNRCEGNIGMDLEEIEPEA
jgi:hypothetical protein